MKCVWGGGGKSQSSLQCNLDLECAWSTHGSSIDYAMAAKFQNFLTLTKISNSVMMKKAYVYVFTYWKHFFLFVGLVYRSTANPMNFQNM